MARNQAQEAPRKQYESERRWQASHKHKISDAAYSVCVRWKGALELESGQEVTVSEAIIEMGRRLNGKDEVEK